MRRVLKRAMLFVALIGLTSLVYAQSNNEPNVSLAQIFTDGDFQQQGFGPARWLDDNSYTTVEASAAVNGARDIIQYEAATGARTVLVSARDLIPAGAAQPLALHNYAWSPDGRTLLLFTNSRRVWRANTRGDYWILNLDTKALRQLGGDAAPSTLMFAKFSPDGSRVAYVQMNNLYVESVEGGTLVQITTDGSETIINGTFDWVYEEEFFLRDGYRWSPDGSHIAFWQLDASGVGEFNLINYTDSLYSKVTPIQYPKTGTTNSAGRVGVISAEGGETVWFEPSDDLRNHYIARMEWAANSGEIVMQHLNRAQNRLEVILGDVETGTMQTVLVEEEDAWIDVRNDFRWLRDGQYFTWVSERDGWRHLYRVSRDGSDIQLITEGDFDVLSVELIDEAGGWLYYSASPQHATQRYLYRTPLFEVGEAERLSPMDEPGWHTYQMAPNAHWAFHTYATFDTPPTIELVRLPSHEVTQALVDNADLRAKVDALGRSDTRFFRVDTGEGVELDGWEMRPRDFDLEKQYPVLFFVYGEPWSQTVVDNWSLTRYLWHHMLTEHGYVVISLDNRGTPAPRGRDWRKVVYGGIGILAAADQAGAARAISRWDYVDPERLGIWGWSGGGSMSLHAIFRFPDVYHTAMSIAPVPDQRYYNTIYQERYMNTPQANSDGYRDGSPITYAHQLEGNLLLIHGTGDDNVHYQGSEALINELIRHNKYFTMMAYPNRSHGIFEGAGTTRHLYELLTRYLLTNMPPGTSSP